jgi:bifunctional non-homologous end joining protein LigD
MPLEEYARKRKFKKTPEPPAAVGQAGEKQRYVIQKHAASRLHYDLRLEHAGVLKSWAVPKGPSLNPANKHLAVMVEDHPLDYIDFEGVIPAGEYGAGRVMVWDKGYYRWAGPEQTVEEQELAFQEGFERGHLSVILAGQKLRGEFALVRAQRAGKNAWLLIKARDDAATDTDVLALDRSVVSNRRLEEIDGPPPPQDAPLAPIPRHVRPMLTTLVGEAFDKPGWLFEVKYDGYRAIGEVSNDSVRLYSRADNSLNERFPAVVSALANLGHDVVLDGEVVVLDSAGRPSFQLIQDYRKDGLGELVYYVFDLLWLDGRDLTALPLTRRKQLLKQVLSGSSSVTFAEHVIDKGITFFKAAAKENLEGIVAKNGDSIYRQGERTRDWLKIKARHRQEFVIGGYTAPRSGRNYFGSLLVGYYRGADLIFAGHVGTGFDERTLADLGARFRSLAEPACPFHGEPKTNEPATWIKPVLVAEVEFAEWTKEGLLRQPSYLGLRDDKQAREVVEERPASEPAAPVSTDNAEPEIPVKLTNPGKILWPQEGITKKEMVDYYDRVAAYILPHLSGRPESMHRFPNGLADAGFWQKNADNNTPDWVKTIAVEAPEEQKVVNYIVCDDRQTLLYLANLGCLEMNPWLSRVGHLDRPDFSVIDLDPLDVPFSAVVEAAAAVREVLRRAGVTGYCKTSGATGMHIYLPLGAKYSYEQARQLAELICVMVNRELPKITSLAREPKDRPKRVYLDYLQNRRGATVAAPYSLRPRPGATVSMPLGWDEVKEGLNPGQFTIRNAAARVEARGDLWADILGPGIDLKKSLLKLKALV